MHIPDGFLSAPVAAGYGLAAALGLVLACRQARRVPARAGSALLGVSAAFVFAAQMVSFPVAAGTSGHLLGGALVAALLGLPRAIVVMAAVLFVQCFVFADGGVLALGANVFNLALVNCVVGSCVYRLTRGREPSPTRRVASLAFAAWCSTLAASASCAEQLALSGIARLSLLFPPMLGVHALVGVGEAVISALVFATVLRLRPELLEHVSSGQRASGRSALGAGLGLSLAIAGLLGPLAYAAPDGLSRVAARLGFLGLERAPFSTPLAGYGAALFGNAWWVTVVLGCSGTLALFGSCWLLARALVPRSRPAQVAPGAVAESSG